jgi:hypothetical protein
MASVSSRGGYEADMKHPIQAGGQLPYQHNEEAKVKVLAKTVQCI